MKVKGQRNDLIDIFAVQLLMPLEFMVDCHAEQLDSFGRQTLIREFAFLHGVLVRIGENQVATSPASTCQVTLRGSRQEMNRLKEAVHHLQRINGSVSPVPVVVTGPVVGLQFIAATLPLFLQDLGQVAMKMEMSAQYLAFIRANAPLIEAQTSTGVLVPADDGHSDADDNSAEQQDVQRLLWVTGSCNSVLEAKLMLMVTFPSFVPVINIVFHFHL